MPFFAVPNPHFTGRKAEAGVYPVRGGTLGEVEEGKDSREALCSTQSSAVLFLLYDTCIHSTLLQSGRFQALVWRGFGILCVWWVF